MMFYIMNASPLSIFPAGERILAEWWPISATTAAQIVATEEAVLSAVGHADTAAVISYVLNYPVPANRATVKLSPGDRALVAQYIGPRLTEGATSLPEGARLEFYLLHGWTGVLPGDEYDAVANAWMHAHLAGDVFDQAE